MKYWLLTSEYPPLHGGGISTYSIYTASMLKEQGHDITVFVYDLSLSEDSFSIENDIRVIRFVPRKTGAHKFLGFNAYISYEYAFAVRELIEKEGVPDVIESQEYHGIAYYLQQFKLLGYEDVRDVPILVTCHAPSFVCLDYNHVPVYKFPEYWTGQMEKSCIRSADILVSPGHYFVEEAKERMNWGGVQEHYLPNPMVVEGLTDKVPDFDRNRIICFGKLSPLKGSFELLQYFEELWKSGFPYSLEIVGGTQQIFHPEGATIGELIRKKYKAYLDSGQLILRGEMTPPDAKTILEKAHVVLVPSLFDNLPYTVLEAMSWGKIVLASRQGGQRDVITHGVNGFLFDHFVAGDFKAQLLQVLELSNEAITTIGENARAEVKQTYSYEAIYPRKLALIQQHIKEKTARSHFPFIEKQNTQEPGLSFSSIKGLLSVVVPYYNMGAYIDECLQSVMRSDYLQKEIIIINDGSTEEASLRKLAELQAKYPITIYNNNNQGLPATRNFGASVAKGEYLAFLDADDLVDKSYYSKAIRVLGQYENVGFVGCWVQYFEGGSGKWPTFNPEPPYLLMHNMVNSSALVMKRECFLQGGMNDPQLVYGMEDWDSIIGMVEEGFGGVVLPEVLFHYRVRKNSMARNFTKVKKIFLHKHIAGKHAQLYQQFGVEIANLLNTNGSGLDFDNPTFESSSSSIIPGSNVFKERLKERVKQNKFLRSIAYKVYKKVKS